MDKNLAKIKKHYPCSTTVSVPKIEFSMWVCFKKQELVEFKEIEATNSVALFRLKLTEKGFAEYENMQFEISMCS